MASSDLRLALVIEAAVRGLAEIAGLERQIEELGGSAGDTGTKARDLAERLDVLARQEQALRRLQALAIEANKLQSELEQTDAEVRDLSEQMRTAGADTEALTAKWKAHSNRLEALEASHRSVQSELRKESETARAAGISVDSLAAASARLSLEANATSAAVSVEIERLRQLAAAAHTAGQAQIGEAERVADAVRAAFGRAGTQTRSDLERLAHQARLDFELILHSGLASAEGLSKAAKRYAEAARSAFGSQVSEAERARLALFGVEKEFWAVGNAAKDTGEKASSGLRSMGDLTSAAQLLASSMLVNQFIQLNSRLEQYNRALIAIKGSEKDAAQEMAFIRATAARLGLDLDVTAQGYIKLAAATKGTKLEGQATRDVFYAVSQAMGVVGASTESTQRALEALAQMASKGTVSMEELRGQLGDSLPGAIQIAARSMGFGADETDRFIKAVENGYVTANEFLPRLAAELRKTYAEGTTHGDAFVQVQNRIKLALTELAESANKEGNLMAGLAIVLKGVTFTATMLSEGLILAAQGVGMLAGAVSTLDLSHLSEEWDRVTTASDQRLQKLVARLEGIPTASDRAALGLDNTGNSAGAAGDKSGKASESFAHLMGRLAETAEKAKVASDYTDVATSAMAAAAAGAEAFSAATDHLNDRLAAQEKAARASGDAARARSIAYETEAEIAARSAEALDQEILLAGKATVEQRKQVAELRNLTQQRKADAEEAKKQATAEEAHAAALVAERTIIRATWSDVEGYAAAWTSARRRLEEDTKAGRANADSKTALIQAAANYQRASAIFQAALQGEIQSLEREDALIKAGFDIRLKKVEYARQEALAAGDVARANALNIDAADLATKQAKAHAEKLQEEAAAAEHSALRLRQLAAANDDTTEATGRAIKAAEDDAAARRNAAQDAAVDAQAKGRVAEALRAQSGAEDWLAERIKAANQAREEEGGNYDMLRGVLASLREEFAAFGQEASAELEWLIKTNLQFGDSVQHAWEIFSKRVEVARAVLERTRAEEEAAVEALLGRLASMQYASEAELNAAQQVIGAFKTLDAAKLDRVKAEVDRLRRASDEARESVEQTNRALRDELDQLLGNQAAIEQRDYAEKKARLEEQLRHAREAGDQQTLQAAQESLRLAEEIHRRKMANIEAEQRAREEADRKDGRPADRDPQTTSGRRVGGEQDDPSGAAETQRHISELNIAQQKHHEEEIARIRERGRVTREELERTSNAARRLSQTASPDLAEMARVVAPHLESLWKRRGLALAKG